MLVGVEGWNGRLRGWGQSGGYAIAGSDGMGARSAQFSASGAQLVTQTLENSVLATNCDPQTFLYRNTVISYPKNIPVPQKAERGRERL